MSEGITGPGPGFLFQYKRGFRSGGRLPAAAPVEPGHDQANVRRAPPGGAGGGRQGGMRRSFLPPAIRRQLVERKREGSVVALDFGVFMEIPYVNDFIEWMVEMKFETPDIGLEKVERQAYDKKFYLTMENEDKLKNILDSFGEEGKEWTDKESGRKVRIMAAREGETWVPVTVMGVSNDTGDDEIKNVFQAFGEVKDIEFVRIGRVKFNEANLLVKVKDGAVLPVFVFSHGVPGHPEQVDRWELMYEGRPLVCYKCFQSGHTRQRCTGQQVTLSDLCSDTRPDLSEGGVPGSYAQVVRSAVSKESVAKRREEAATKLQQDHDKKEEEEREKQERKDRYKAEKLEKERNKAEAEQKRQQEAWEEEREFLKKIKEKEEKRNKERMEIVKQMEAERKKGEQIEEEVYRLQQGSTPVKRKRHSRGRSPTPHVRGGGRRNGSGEGRDRRGDQDRSHFSDNRHGR